MSLDIWFLVILAVIAIVVVWLDIKNIDEEDEAW